MRIMWKLFHILLGATLLLGSRPFARIIVDFQAKTWGLTIPKSSVTYTTVMIVLAGIAFVLIGIVE